MRSLTKRRTIGLLVSGAVMAAATTALPNAARAIEAPGSGFDAFTLTARAAVLGYDADKFVGQAAGSTIGGVPFTEATASGFSTRALSSIAWPGALAGNVGKLLQLAPNTVPVPVPPEVQAYYPLLNYPIYAQAQSAGQQDDSLAIPGATMTASARDAATVADAIIGGAMSANLMSFATGRATSMALVTGEAAAEVDARSYVENVDIGGMLKIGSVTSIAHVTTDGVTGTPTGKTLFTDVVINGEPVTIDGDGIHGGGQTAPLDALTGGLSAALAQAGITVTWTAPIQTKKAGSASYTAAALKVVVDYSPFSADWPGPIVFTFGGASATASAFAGTPFETPGELPDLGGSTGGGDLGGGTGGSGVLPGLDGTGTVAPGTGTGTGPVTPGTGTGTGNTGGGAPIFDFAAGAADLPDGTAPIWFLIALLAAGILGRALARGPVKVLSTSATPCPLEGKE